jgi:hypothetical protein
VAELAWAWTGWAWDTRRCREQDALTRDLTTVRGTGPVLTEGTSWARQLRSVSGHDRPETLIRARVDDKRNVLPVAYALLSDRPMRGRVVTVDILAPAAADPLARKDHAGLHHGHALQTIGARRGLRNILIHRTACT